MVATELENSEKPGNSIEFKKISGYLPVFNEFKKIIFY